MIRWFTQYPSTWIAFILSALALGLSVQPGAAQSPDLKLIQTAEYDLGFDCPAASALDPTGTILWVLLDNCGQSDYALRAYQVADGTQVNTDEYTAVLAQLDGFYVDWWITPLGFTPTGDLSLRYNDPDTYASIHLLIPMTGGSEATVQTSVTYDALLAQFSEFPEYSVYSPDHTRVVAADGAGFHVIDVQAEAEIIAIPVEGGTDNAAASFSVDGERLEVVRYNATDGNDHTVTLLLYSLPDGELLRQYSLPSSPVWISPDGTYAAVNLWSNNVGDVNDLVVIDLETGLASPATSLNEDPAQVTTCLNNGHDVRDVDFRTSGRFQMAGLHWLPDSSSLAVPLSYNGESAGGGSICIFNYSRLRTYRVEATG